MAKSREFVLMSPTPRFGDGFSCLRLVYAVCPGTCSDPGEIHVVETRHLLVTNCYKPNLGRC